MTGFRSPVKTEAELRTLIGGEPSALAVAKEQHGLVRREALHRVRIVLERSARSAELGLQLLYIRTVQNLRLLDVVDFEVGVQGDVVVQNLVDETLDTKVVNEKLDLSDFLLDAFLVVR